MAELRKTRSGTTRCLIGREDKLISGTTRAKAWQKEVGSLRVGARGRDMVGHTVGCHLASLRTWPSPFPSLEQGSCLRTGLPHSLKPYHLPQGCAASYPNPSSFLVNRTCPDHSHSRAHLSSSFSSHLCRLLKSFNFLSFFFRKVSIS